MFTLDKADRVHPVLSRRLTASKPARLVAPPKTKGEADIDQTSGNRMDLAERVDSLVLEVKRAIEHFENTKRGAPCPAIGVVVNRVNRARAVFAKLEHDLPAGAVDLPLLIGPARPIDRDVLAGQLAAIRTGAPRALERPLLIVATQCIEAGVDIDLDGLVTEAAPLDALRQRFGRLNRAGRQVQPYASIVAARGDIAARADDPVYGPAIATAWRALNDAAVGKAAAKTVEFGLSGFTVSMEAEALSPRPDAPVLLPAHLDLLSQTSPIPGTDPDIGLFLHGPDRQPDSITVVWRSDIDPAAQRNDQVRRLLMLAPPRSLESIQLPLWAVRRWLAREPQAADLADVASAAEADDAVRAATSSRSRACYRWTGDDERSRWIDAADVRAGDTIVVPSGCGGVDAFGWNPARNEPAIDVGREAALPFAGRRFAVRVAPGLLGGIGADVLADALSRAVTQRWQDLRAAVLDLDLPEAMRNDLLALDRAHRRRVFADVEVYGDDGEGHPRGVVFVAPFGIDGGARSEDGIANTTEDDATGSLPGFRLTLTQHSADVEGKAEQFALACVASPRVRDLKLAGFLHDAGKADPRFQAWLHYDDPFGPSMDDLDDVLAKSARPLPAAARAASALPANWRHEALSVRLALHTAAVAQADDPELVVWLIGSHHGFGRPFFPHEDPEDGRPRMLPAVLGIPAELPAAPGPQSLAFDWHGLDWAALFARLKARYGVWELARMEAIVRLADHRASEEAARRSEEPDE
jgi:CRISPR-associated endonuclease/helicase Cas3